MEGYFFEDSASCVDAVLSSIPENSSISWGGSETIKESGLMDKIRQGSISSLTVSAPLPLRKAGNCMPSRFYPIITL